MAGAPAAKAEAESREGGGREVKVAALLAGVDGSRVLTRRNSVGGCAHVSLATKPPQPSPKKSKAAAAVDPAQSRAALEAAAQQAEVRSPHCHCESE